MIGMSWLVINFIYYKPNITKVQNICALLPNLSHGGDLSHDPVTCSQSYLIYILIPPSVQVSKYKSLVSSSLFWFTIRSSLDGTSSQRSLPYAKETINKDISKITRSTSKFDNRSKHTAWHLRGGVHIRVETILSQARKISSFLGLEFEFYVTSEQQIHRMKTCL